MNSANFDITISLEKKQKRKLHFSSVLASVPSEDVLVKV